MSLKTCATTVKAIGQIVAVPVTLMTLASMLYYGIKTAREALEDNAANKNTDSGSDIRYSFRDRLPRRYRQVPEF